MTVKPNGTDAKDVALHFLKITGVERATPAIVAKTIVQAKSILKSGYSKEEIVSVIDHIVEKGVRMYSLGYVSHAIHDALEEIKELRIKEEATRIAKRLQEEQIKSRSEVTSDGESSERNRNKAQRFGVKPWKRAKFDFDMFEE